MECLSQAHRGPQKGDPDHEESGQDLQGGVGLQEHGWRFHIEECSQVSHGHLHE